MPSSAMESEGDKMQNRLISKSARFMRTPFVYRCENRSTKRFSLTPARPSRLIVLFACLSGGREEGLDSLLSDLALAGLAKCRAFQVNPFNGMRSRHRAAIIVTVRQVHRVSQFMYCFFHQA